MRHTIRVRVVPILGCLVLAFSTSIACAQKAPAHGGPAAGPPPKPQLLFSMTFENEARMPLSQNVLTTPDADLHLYGAGKDIIIAVGKGPYAPHTFNGYCDRPCGFTVSDRKNYFDLRENANIQFTTIVSGFHRVRPLIRLADGTLLIGDQADGSTADWHPFEISFSDVRWLKLDPKLGVTLGDSWVPNPDLSRVEEVGYFDVIPGSGPRVEGLPVEKMPPAPPGGWIAVSSFQLWGKPVPRNSQ
jgi:hypothetical protein